jgi:cell division protease FtsH
MRRATITRALLTIGVYALTLGFGGAARAQWDVDGVNSAMATPNGAPSPPPANGRPEAELAYSDFIAQVDKGEVRQVITDDRIVRGELTNGKSFRTTAPDDPGMVARLLEHRVKVSVAQTGGVSLWMGLLGGGLPLLLMIGMTIYFLRSSKPQAGSGGGALGIGQSRARRLTPDAQRVTFADVAGIDEAEQELREIVDFLKAPEKLQRLGGKIPRGCLLVGPPGTGKTLLARAIAGEAGVPFFAISGSDFVEMFVGVGASRVRDLFVKAKKDAPSIIFIDEIDAVGRHRGAGHGGGNDERDQTLNQLLVEMDGFEANEGVILIAATNRPDVLDPALLRPGRFDRQVVVSAPDVAGREQILSVYLLRTPLAPDVDVKVIARGTPGFSGADLANLVNEAAILAARRGADHISSVELEEDKVMMGAERRSLVMTQAEKETTAYHEAGHALVAFHSPGHDPLHNVTITPRGRALGMTVSLPERDRYGFARQELEAKIAMMFGGRVAEELVYGKDRVTTGASDDIRQATGLARRMVTEFGFSDRLGPLSYAAQDQGGFLGDGGPARLNVSEATARIIDREIRRIVEKGASRARAILTERFDQLQRLATALLEQETPTGADISSLLSALPCEGGSTASGPPGASTDKSPNAIGSAVGVRSGPGPCRAAPYAPARTGP